MKNRDINDKILKTKFDLFEPNLESLDFKQVHSDYLTRKHVTKYITRKLFAYTVLSILTLSTLIYFITSQERAKTQVQLFEEEQISHTNDSIYSSSGNPNVTSTKKSSALKSEQHIAHSQQSNKVSRSTNTFAQKNNTASPLKKQNPYTKQNSSRFINKKTISVHGSVIFPKVEKDDVGNINTAAIKSVSESSHKSAPAFTSSKLQQVTERDQKSTTDFIVGDNKEKFESKRNPSENHRSNLQGIDEEKRTNNSHDPSETVVKKTENNHNVSAPIENPNNTLNSDSIAMRSQDTIKINEKITLTILEQTELEEGFGNVDQDGGAKNFNDSIVAIEPKVTLPTSPSIPAASASLTNTPANKPWRFTIATEALLNRSNVKLQKGKVLDDSTNSLFAQKYLEGHEVQNRPQISASLLFGCYYKNLGINSGISLLSFETKVKTSEMAFNSTRNVYINDSTYIVITDPKTILVNGDTVSANEFQNKTYLITVPLNLSYKFNIYGRRFAVEPSAGVQLGIATKSQQLTTIRPYEFVLAKTKTNYRALNIFYDFALKLSYQISPSGYLYIKQGYYFSNKSIYGDNYLLKAYLKNTYTSIGVSLLLR